MTMHYDEIKTLAKRLKVRVTDLIALAPKNDPFYVGTPADRVWGEWFAELYHRFGYQRGVHCRRIHYRIVSQETPVKLPVIRGDSDGEDYTNTEECWGKLTEASKKARYLKLVDTEDFDDKRNPDPVDYALYVDTDTRLAVQDDSFFTVDLPGLPDLPAYALDGYTAEQRYHTEIWCEKSTMNDILEPIARSFAATLQIGVGELSITKTLMLAQRIDGKGKPARIFYVSDFDPAGKSMPVAVARKLEYFIDTLGLDLDVRLFPLVLTESQCRAYRLPRTPIKASERRAARFEERFGEGATELDALEANHPGELARIVGDAMRRYYDHDLHHRVFRARDALFSALWHIEQTVRARHQAEIDALRDDYESLRARLSGELEGLAARRRNVWQAVRDDLEAEAPDLDGYPVPEPVVAAEPDDALFDTDRDYLDQLAVYKDFQGKAA